MYRWICTKYEIFLQTPNKAEGLGTRTRKMCRFLAKFVVYKKYISFCLEHWTLQNKDYTSNKKVQGDEFMVTFEL